MALPEHSKEFLGGNFWGTESYYWDADEKKYYYISTTGGNYSATGWNYEEVTDKETLDRLAKKYNRGEDYLSGDFNPQLETKTTIKTRFGGAGVAPEGAAGSVRFPSDMLVDEGEDFVMFDFYNYKPPFQDKKIGEGNSVNQTLRDYNDSGFGSEYFKEKEFPQIIMYMPQDVQDKFSAKWEGKKFGAVTAGIIAGAGQSGAVNKLQETAGNLAKNLTEKGSVEAAAAVVSKLAKGLTGDDISAGDLFGGISGVARNPNVEVLFQNIELRTFDLTFKMAPYSERDVQSMDAIIKIFKQAMLPQYRLGKDDKVFGQDGQKGALQGGFIKVPRVCAVNFMRGNRRNRFLPRYKMCAITDVGVNYTPDGTYATFDRSSPVATEIKISFMETKLVFSEDISDRGF